MSIIVEIQSLDEFKNLKSLWGTLSQQTPNASFFQSLIWTQNYWRHFGRENLLKIMLIGDRQRVLGIVPLCVRKIDGPGLGLRVL
ncbi:MAG: hypothetical protein O3A00_18270 [Planctomycetota bacterium]|nr:hypothetical protein [Planctomycetota bacterium]